MKKSLGVRLKELRGKLNQTEIANVFALSCQAWSSYECDAKEPTLSTICRICQHFNVSAGWLLGLEEKETTLPEGSFKYTGRAATEAYVDSKVAESHATCPNCAAKEARIIMLEETLHNLSMGRSTAVQTPGLKTAKY